MLRRFTTSTTKRVARIAILGDPGSDGDEYLESLPEGAHIHSYLTPEQMRAGDIDPSINVLLASETVTPENLGFLLRSTKNIEWIHSRWAGINHLLCPELRESDIPLTNVRGASSHNLAEFCLFGCLYFEKMAPRMLDQKRRRHWEKFMVGEIRGKTLGVIGLGDIGRNCAEICKSNGMKIAALRRRAIFDPLIDFPFESQDLAGLMSTSDYVVSALPLTPETHHFVNASAFSHARPHTVFINVGRGACVDEMALISALENGTIRGACLDVFENEPLPVTSPLWSMENVFISPHCVDTTDKYWAGNMGTFLRHLDSFLEGRSFDSVCDKNAGY